MYIPIGFTSSAMPMLTLIDKVTSKLHQPRGQARPFHTCICIPGRLVPFLWYFVEFPTRSRGRLLSADGYGKRLRIRP